MPMTRQQVRDQVQVARQENALVERLVRARRPRAHELETILAALQGPATQCAVSGWVLANVVSRATLDETHMTQLAASRNAHVIEALARRHDLSESVAHALASDCVVAVEPLVQNAQMGHAGVLDGIRDAALRTLDVYVRPPAATELPPVWGLDDASALARETTPAQIEDGTWTPWTGQAGDAHAVLVALLGGRRRDRARDWHAIATVRSLPLLGLLSYHTRTPRAAVLRLIDQLPRYRAAVAHRLAHPGAGPVAPGVLEATLQDATLCLAANRHAPPELALAALRTLPDGPEGLSARARTRRDAGPVGAVLLHRLVAQDGAVPRDVLERLRTSRDQELRALALQQMVEQGLAEVRPVGPPAEGPGQADGALRVR